MAQTVADVLVEALEQIGVKQIFGLIGDSLNPLADAVRRSSKIEWIGVRHEEGAALAAAGQAKLTGRLGVCAGTTGPGSTHLVAGLYEASRDHAPVLALSGDMARKLQGTDYHPDHRAGPAVPRRLALHRDHLVAGAGAGRYPPGHRGRLCRPRRRPPDAAAGRVAAKADGERRQPRHPEAARRDFAASEADIAEIARRIDEAGSVVIMCGDGCHGAADELRALSDRLKAPLIHSVKGKDIMPYDDPRWMGGIGMIGTKPVYHAVMRLRPVADARHRLSLFASSCRTKATVIQIDERAQVLGRRAPTVLGVAGSVRPTLKLLLDQVKPKTDAQILRQRRRRAAQVGRDAGQAGRSRRAARTASIRRRWPARSATWPRATRCSCSTPASTRCGRPTGSGRAAQQRIIGSFNNAAVGTALGQANGIQALDRSRQVIALCGDGGFNMLMCEFLTAVHHKLPVKVVVYNNSALGLITLEAEASGFRPCKAIEFPNPDFAALARACGGQGFTAGKPGELREAIAEALAVDGPAIVDCVVPADELPNLPHRRSGEVENSPRRRSRKRFWPLPAGDGDGPSSVRAA